MSSTKNAQPYYPHNANARNEDNMIRLRMIHGVAGYGVYHMLLERLRMSDDYKCDLDYNILSWDLDCSTELIRSVIYDFGLFEIVDEGQRFASVELNAYMRLMEQKAAERSARAQEAANARWGNSSSKENAKTAEQPRIPLEVDKPSDSSERLDKEIEAIKGDETWLDEMAKESGKTKDEIISFLSDFRTQCMLRGLKGGHKDMADTLTHFRSWIYKSGRAKDPNAKRESSSNGGIRGTAKTEHERRLEREAETAERNARYEANAKNAANVRLRIMNKGYDPEEVDLVKLAQLDFEKNNPPTHPEWIGKFEQNVEVPY